MWAKWFYPGIKNSESSRWIKSIVSFFGRYCPFAQWEFRKVFQNCPWASS